MATSSPSPQDTENRLKDFLAFPFHEDKAFLEGLQLLLDQPVVETFQRGGPITPELEQALLGPKVFYYNRQHGTDLTAELVEEYTRTRPQVISQPGPNTPGTPPFTPLSKTPDEDRQLSLAELTRLIETGQTHLIPHNYTIPDGVQAQAPEPPKIPIKKKPWERTDQEESFWPAAALAPPCINCYLCLEWLVFFSGRQGCNNITTSTTRACVNDCLPGRARAHPSECCNGTPSRSRTIGLIVKSPDFDRVPARAHNRGRIPFAGARRVGRSVPPNTIASGPAGTLSSRS